MASPALVATHSRHAGVAVIDASTGVHFGIGTAAGLSGIDPKMALLIALCAEGAYEVLKHRSAEAIFERGVGQSKINEIVDLLAMVAGAYVGQGIRNAIREHPVIEAAAPSSESLVATAGLGAIANVSPRYTVWEWDEYNGWKLFLGSNNWNSADQVRRALKAYQPQKWYGVYGTYSLSPSYEITGIQGVQRFSWGYAPAGDNVWETVYALSKLLRVDTVVNALKHDPLATAIWWPDFIRYELADRTRTARMMGTAAA